MQNSLRGKTKLIVIAALAAGLLFAAGMYRQYAGAPPGIKIGVLHSLTGTMASSEAPLVDAVRLAVEEINRAGGINGAKVEMIVSDCRSDAEFCAQQAEQLISQDGVQALFGCWTSACRKAVKPVVEKHRHLLFYPVQYEGLEQSPDIIYTGATPNQQVVPMVTWAMQQRGKRAYLIGSDYVFPRTENQIVKKLLRARGGVPVAERYVQLGAKNLDAVVSEIRETHPDFILNTLNGDSNRYFFRALRKADIRAGDIPVFSTSIAESELAAMGPDLMAGHYAAWSYFQSIDRDENRAFVERFRSRFGRQRVLDDPMEAAYIGVQLWANALRSAGTLNLATVKAVLAQQTLDAPEGIVAVDAATRHLWKPVRIGKARDDGQFEIVWQSAGSVAPAPFPFFIPRAELPSLAGGVR
ncbi:MAG TPA: ABC transporter substrate-binding protein [Gallionella sp.]|nr:ABC transporter substrate-binding protein [Gallionella sp.]